MIKSLGKMLISLLVAVIVAVPNYSVCRAENETDLTIDSDIGTVGGYASYVKKWTSEPSGENISVFPGEAFIDKGESVDFGFAAEKEGSYRISFEYLAENDSKNSLEAALYIDGEAPFNETENLVMTRLWRSEPGTDSFVEGANDIRPSMVEEKSWQTYCVKDAEGYVSDPFEFYISQSEHILTIKNSGEAFRIKNLRLTGDFSETISYDDYLKHYSDAQRYDGDTVTVQAEKFSRVSSRSLVISSDLSDPVTYPSDYSYIKLNTLGGTNWKYVGNTAMWTVTAPRNGLYKTAIRFKQNYYNGISTHRRLTVNGNTPFKEAEDISFEYGVGWQLNTLEDRYIYLNEGENEIALEAVLGNNAQILSELENIIYSLNSLYRKIITITGTSPDIYRDYNLHLEIPDLIPSLKELSEKTERLLQFIEREHNGKGSETAVLSQISVQIDDMIKKPSSITKSSRLSRFKSNISSLGTWANKLREQPLEIDLIAFVGETGKNPLVKAGFFELLRYRTRRFLSSFVTDYSKLGEENGSNTSASLRVWVATGRDQAQLLKNMVEDTFTPEYDIGISVELVSGGLVEAILADRGPDIALDRSQTDPVNLAMRNAIHDLSVLDDFNEVREWFCECSLIPFEYQGGVYALPITQSFNMMFYRTDIFREYGIEVPRTWENFILYTLPVLNSNNMTAGIGAVTESSIFKTILYQSGGKVYNEELTRAMLDSQVAYEAFKTATEFYTDYGLPTSYDFMNRFRTGEMPLAIAPYTAYNNLKLSAPELNGMWEMACIPGIMDKNGNINNTQLMTATCAVITKNCTDINAAWKFLKWFLSADVQGRYGTDLESILGAAGRYNPSNTEAMRQLSWGSEQLDLLELQRSTVTDMPNIPGSYFTQRAINNAFVSAVIDSQNPREALLYWNEEINFELERKREEFNFEPAQVG